MNQKWDQFGFLGNPYSVKPLDYEEADQTLFYGRQMESARFQTKIEEGEGCLIVISGPPGVGKTSFVNFQQKTLPSVFGGTLKIIPDLHRTPVQPGDTPNDLARRFTTNIISSIADYCEAQRAHLPAKLSTVQKWLSYTADGAGFDLGAFGLSFGRSYQVPNVEAATVETFRDILKPALSDACSSLGVNGVFACFENVESLAEADLARLFMSLRDTLFSVPNIFFVIIGQSGLYDTLDRIDQRISQRIKGRGIEIEPFTGEDLHKLVELRIKKYRAKDEAVSPLSSAVHQVIFDGAHGIPRAALHRADELLDEILARARSTVSAAFVNAGIAANPTALNRDCMKAIQEILIDQRIPDRLALRILIQQSVNCLIGVSTDSDVIVSTIKRKIDKYLDTGGEFDTGALLALLGEFSNLSHVWGNDSKDPPVSEIEKRARGILLTLEAAITQLNGS